MDEVTGLPRVGERWFKYWGIEGKEWKEFLKNPGMDTTIFKNGIPSTILKSKWRNLLLVIQKFITCEDRFGSMFFYHVYLMMHFLEGNEINLPYFLLNSLRKMSSNTQRKIQFIENIMYHHGLVKMLIEAHLEKLEDNWESFIIRNNFKEIEQEEPSSSKVKRSRRKLSENPVGNPLPQPE